MSQSLIWITRSQPGADRLAEQLRTHGFDVLVAPVLEIAPVTLDQALPAHIDVAVALSEHAVIHAPEGLWQRAAQVISVGAQTAKSLAQRGIAASHPPLASSEGLLEGPLRGIGPGRERVALVSGRGGRTLLAQSLIAAGASVFAAEVYERQATAQMPTNLSQVSAIVVSSGDGFEAAGRLWFEAAQGPEVPVFAPSLRVAAMASGIGFAGAHSCGGADPQSVLTALQNAASGPS